MKMLRVLIPTLVLGLGACEGGGGPSGESVVARAGGFELSAEATAEILAPQIELEPQPEVIQALADLWVQYFLLAKASLEDSTLAQVDLGPLVQRQVENALVTELRDVVLQVDTAMTDEELRRRFETEAPDARVRARHILLQFPQGAPSAQTDSVRALAASLRDRILAGEDFEAIAAEYSQDTGTAGNGGDLGSFGRGEMVPPFEEAAFSLELGTLSEVVETAFGLHLIRVDERITPDFDEQQSQFRLQLQNQILMEAESTFVADLVEAAEMETSPEGFEAIRQLALDPGMELSSRALGRRLVGYRGGAFTLGEFRHWLLTSAPTIPGQIQTATDDQLDNLLQSLSRSELLVNEALSEGIEIPQERQDSMVTGILVGVRGIAQELGFFEISTMEGESLDEAADRVVREIMAQVVQEGREVYPLQTVAYALKEQYGAQFYQPGVARAVELVNEIRATPLAPTTMTPEPVQDTTVGDTVGDRAGGQG